MALSKAAPSYDVELDMLCEEESLDVNALEAYQRAQYDYILVEKLIEEARKNGVEVFYINSADEMNTIPLPAGIEDADIASMTPDIIVLDEELALARSAKMAAKQLSGVSAVLGRVGPAQPNIIRLPTSAGVKRSSTAAGGPAAKSSKTENLPPESDPGTLVPLEEYYYGKQEGDPTYHEEKGEYRFKCWYCHKMLYNNIRIMMHMQGHIDSEKQQNIDLSDLTQCKHCYKQLDTPFEMQRHIEQVHQAQSNALVCRICEKDHKNESELRTHMRQYHRACEMPYVCQLCNFRSSFYSDIVDHFKKRHDSSTFVSCLYCLRVFQVRFSKSGGWGLTQNYYFHLQKHQTKACQKKCTNCKLTFFSKEDVAKHGKDHTSNQRGIIHGSGGVRAANDKVMIAVPQKGQSVKSLNAPAVTKVQDMQGVRMYGLEARHMCLECQQPMMVPAHYKRFVECSLCRFASTCNQALSMHMMSMHSGIKNIRFKNFPWERKMSTELYCLCGFSTFYGNLLANHLIQCSKRTAYASKPDVKWIEYDDEHEEYNPFDDAAAAAEESEPLDDANEPNIFGALGLVKKGVPAPRSRKGNQDSAVGDDVSPKKQSDPDSSTAESGKKQTRSKYSILQGGSAKKGEAKSSSEGDAEMTDLAEATSSTDAS